MMRYKFACVGSVIVAMLGVGLLLADETADSQEPSQRIVEGNNAFAVDLYGRLGKTDGNLFFSPYSINICLDMVAAGARGETAAGMNKVLYLPAGESDSAALQTAIGELVSRYQADRDSRGYELHVANALWGQKGKPWVPEYLDSLQKNYGAGLVPVDFADAAGSAATINKWVADKTKDKIKDLISPDMLSASTKLVLTNAIYFKGDWQLPFDPTATSDAKWNPSDTAQNSTSVPMMHQQAHFGIYQDDELSALEIPYKGGDLSMLVLLPNAPDGLANVEKNLSGQRLSTIARGLNDREVALSFPKFKLESKFELRDILRSMGMDLALSDRADFSGMDGSHDLFISAVVHQAFVAVDEAGTEAAAATGTGMTASAMPSRPMEFNADHPFIFLIRDRQTGMILFMGRLVQPEKAQ